MEYTVGNNLANAQAAAINFRYEFSIKLTMVIRVTVVRSRTVAGDWRLHSGGEPGIL